MKLITEISVLTQSIGQICQAEPVQQVVSFLCQKGYTHIPWDKL